MLGSSGNPAISVAMELRHWIRNSCTNELTADAVNLPWVERSNRRAALRLNDVVTAAAESDPDGAVAAWTDYVTYTTPFFHNLGDRLVLDMLDLGARSARSPAGMTGLSRPTRPADKTTVGGPCRTSDNGHHFVNYLGPGSHRAPICRPKSADSSTSTRHDGACCVDGSLDI